MKKHYFRTIFNGFMMLLALALTLVGLFILGWLLWDLTAKGIQHVNWQVFTQDTPGPGGEGGLRNAMVGTLLITFWAMLMAIPIGILAGTYLAEYGRGTLLANIIRFVNDVLLSAPSIVLGVFVYAVVVQPRLLGPDTSYSAMAGSFALALIAIPIIIRTTENMLLLVPSTMREAAAALGAPRSLVITKIVYRASLSGLATGLLLSVAQLIGETAPLLFTAFGNQFWNTNMMEPMAALPPKIFEFAMSPYDTWINLAWAGAFLLTLFVLLINIITRIALRSSKS